MAKRGPVTGKHCDLTSPDHHKPAICRPHLRNHLSTRLRSAMRKQGRSRDLHAGAESGFEGFHEGIDVATSSGKLVVAEHEHPPVIRFRDHAGGPVTDERGEARLHLIEVDEFKGNPEGANPLIPGGLSSQGRVGDVAERARLAAQVVADEVANFADEASVSPIDADEAAEVLGQRWSHGEARSFRFRLPSFPTRNPSIGRR